MVRTDFRSLLPFPAANMMWAFPHHLGSIRGRALMAQDMTIPDPAVVLDLIEGFRRSKVLFAGVSLGLFDVLESGPATLAMLAERLSANGDSLERLLDACVGLQLLTKSTADDPAIYSNTPAAAAYLCGTSPRRLTGYINYSNEFLWPLWGRLEDAVREGTHRWPQVYGWDGPIFNNFFKDETAKREFLLGMHGYGLISSPQAVQAFDLSRFKCLVDLGGATGHLAVAACQRYPQLSAVVFDLPAAVPLAREMIEGTGVAGRVQVVGGDFFTDALPAGDVYALGRILHDWTEEKIVRLLARIFAALPSGGALLIAEKVLLDDKTGPRWAQLQSLNMLVCTEGKERSAAEYERLLAQAGFTDVQVARTGSPLDAVFALKR